MDFRIRLDLAMVKRGLVETRSQAESWIGLGQVFVNGKVAVKSGQKVSPSDKLELRAKEMYVSRAGLKLASVAQILGVDFAGKLVLDVGSSTGGFTDYALQHGAKKVIAVDVGTEQLHPKLRGDPRVELYEKTDIRDVGVGSSELGVGKKVLLKQSPDIVVIDVSFISLREVLPSISQLLAPNSQIIAMVKPQFEAGRTQLTKTGILKNDTIRRQVLKDFELWSKAYFRIIRKADSSVAGSKGNRERFYLLKKLY